MIFVLRIVVTHSKTRINADEQWFQEASTVAAFKRDNEIESWPQNPPPALKTRQLDLSGQPRDVVMSGTQGREDVWRIWGSHHMETDLFTIREDGRKLFLVDQAKLHSQAHVVSQRHAWLSAGTKAEVVLDAIAKLKQDEEARRNKDQNPAVGSSPFGQLQMPGGAAMLALPAPASGEAQANNRPMLRRLSDPDEGAQAGASLFSFAQQSVQYNNGNESDEDNVQCRQEVVEYTTTELREICLQMKTAASRVGLADKVKEYQSKGRQLENKLKSVLFDDEIVPVQLVLVAIPNWLKFLSQCGPQKYHVQLDPSKCRPSGAASFTSLMEWIQEDDTLVDYTPMDATLCYQCLKGQQMVDMGKPPSHLDAFVFKTEFMDGKRYFKSLDLEDKETYQKVMLLYFVKVIMGGCLSLADAGSKREKLHKFFFAWTEDTFQSTGSRITSNCILDENLRGTVEAIAALFFLRKGSSGTLNDDIVQWEKSKKTCEFAIAVNNNVHTGRFLVDAAIKQSKEWSEEVGKQEKVKASKDTIDEVATEIAKLIAEFKADEAETLKKMDATYTTFLIELFLKGVAKAAEFSADKGSEVFTSFIGVTSRILVLAIRWGLACVNASATALGLSHATMLLLEGTCTGFLKFLKGTVASAPYHKLLSSGPMPPQLSQALLPVKNVEPFWTAALEGLSNVAELAITDLGDPDASDSHKEIKFDDALSGQIAEQVSANFSTDEYRKMVGSVCSLEGILTHLSSSFKAFTHMKTQAGGDNSSFFALLSWTQQSLRVRVCEAKGAVTQSFDDSRTSLTFDVKKVGSGWSAPEDYVIQDNEAEVNAAATYTLDNNKFEAAKLFARCFAEGDDESSALEAKTAFDHVKSSGCTLMLQLKHFVGADQKLAEGAGLDSCVSKIRFLSAGEPDSQILVVKHMCSLLAEMVKSCRRAKRFLPADNAGLYPAHKEYSRFTTHVAAGSLSYLIKKIHNTIKNCKYPKEWESIICSFDQTEITKLFFNEEFESTDKFVDMTGQMFDNIQAFSKDAASFMSEEKQFLNAFECLESAMKKMRKMTSMIQGCNMAWFDFPKYSVQSNVASKNSCSRREPMLS